jgi:hypothetical protein
MIQQQATNLTPRWAGGRPAREVASCPTSRRRRQTSAPVRVAVRSRVQRAVRQAGRGQVPEAAGCRLAAASPGRPDAAADRRSRRAGERRGGASVPVLLLPVGYRIDTWIG